jgi:hypothetical protein
MHVLLPEEEAKARKEGIVPQTCGRMPAARFVALPHKLDLN